MTTETQNTTAKASENVTHTVNSAADALLSLLPEEGQEGEEAQAEGEESEETEQEASEESTEETQEETEENPDEGEETEQEQQPAKIRVKADGEEIEVTLDELKNGYSRTKDYTRKTQEISEQRKKLEAEFNEVSAERQQYSQLLGKLAQQLESTQGQEPDWDHLRETDPIQYSIAATDWQRNQQKRQAIAQEQGRLQQLQQQEMIAKAQATLERERGALLTVIPEWKDAAKAKADQAKIREQGKKLGFSDKELEQVYDHRAVIALRKAALYDEMMDKRKAVVPVKAPQKVLSAGNKPGRNVDSSRVNQAKQNFRASGNIRNAANLLNLMEN